ncbi:[acyl-carrier-protein] S-malonyltransferase [bacterium F16]|nr:[acyl-carrier-protein] S-malonyltransferase [bacterium F16]
MTNIFMFPGQGSQKKGMGEDLFERFSELTAQADAILGYSIKTLCLEDPNEELNKTQFTQPALYIVGALSYLAKLEDEKVTPDYVIGHSLGEYPALFAAGAFDFATGLELVQKRGALMSQATGGGMAAILGLDGDATKAALDELGADTIDVANYNTPGQTVISGLKDDIDEIAPKLQEKGAKRAIVLNVSGAFHSRYMQAAADEFAEFIASKPLQSLKTPCLANCSGELYQSAKVAENLVRQITSSVLWIKTINFLKDKPGATFTEVGPGKVLTGMMRQFK